MGNALLFDAAEQNGVDSTTFSVSTWWLKEGAGGGTVEERRELCESLDMVYIYIGEVVFNRVEANTVFKFVVKIEDLIALTI